MWEVMAPEGLGVHAGLISGGRKDRKEPSQIYKASKFPEVRT